ncbi:DUF1801 domain-containing protein [Nitratireductor sp. ZSWI3]|uniref:DUF1801 domain-containing protein n=1 Tax=Nitratireductor sp. ZSWI3 TaxID=2966359 RepID=UPI0021502EB4|nr:DUF1801 domain-containing protein [Nitratireductor sp. ZSWI3]MCR4268559.1 DUF1801 domain-containing protein [Nitratireductor sp. ZSWI3]
MEDIVFQVTANTLTEYLNFDPARKDDLDQLDALIRKSAPALKRHFHQGTPAGDAGMRMKMIGYGKFRYSIKSGKATDWPVIGLALQKNYISLYFSITVDGAPIVDLYKGRLGEKRSGRNNFSFVEFGDLKIDAIADLIAKSAEIFGDDPNNPVRYREG